MSESVEAPRSPPLPRWPGFAASGVVACVYLAVASGGAFTFEQSPFPHHIVIADAWLHGQMSAREEVLAERVEHSYEVLRRRFARQLAAEGRTLTPEMWQRGRAQLAPRPTLDWATFEGRRYGYWAPMPALLLLPWVAALGTDISDRLFSCLVAAVGVLLVYLMLREATRTGLLVVTREAAVALTLLAGLGTVHFYLAVLGQVWFLAQIVAAFFLTLAVTCALRSDLGRRWAWASGCALGAALLSRSTALATLPFFACCLMVLGRRRGSSTVLGDAVAFGVPVAMAIGAALGFNYARFGNPFESGQALTIMTGGTPQLRAEVELYGRFSLHYVWRNAYYYLVNPFLRYHPSTQALTFDPQGNSLFLVTPAFLYLFRAWRRCDLFFLGAWSSVALSLAGLLILYATGWYQFGNRYLVDFLPLLILLVGRGMRGRLTPTSAALIALSVGIHAWGTYRFLLEQS